MSVPAAVPVSRRARDLPDLRALEVFATVCEAGSMALAAQRLGITQSAVSQLVKALEQEFGSTLFDRELRPARLTGAGRLLLAQAEALLAQARALTERMRDHAHERRAQLRLGCVDSFAATVGPALIRALSGSARQIQMWSGLTPALTAQLRGREVDLAICTDGALADARVRHSLLFSEAWVAVFPRTHDPVPDGAPAPSCAELARRAGDLPLIRYTRRSVIGQQIERYLRHVGVEAPSRFEFDATDPMLSLVAAGLGWAISSPLCLWQARQYLGEVRVVPLPTARLGGREFFLLAHTGDVQGLGDEIARVTRQLVRHQMAPAIHALIPGLPPQALSFPEESV